MPSASAPRAISAALRPATSGGVGTTPSAASTRSVTASIAAHGSACSKAGSRATQPRQTSSGSRQQIAPFVGELPPTIRPWI